jgi:hypothetical protein
MGRITAKLVETVADVEGVEPTDLEYSLQEYIALDAVEQLAEQDTTSWTFSFELPEYTVTVTSEREVSVAERETEKTHVATPDGR